MTISPSLKPHWPKRARGQRSIDCDDKRLTGKEPLDVLDVVDAPVKLTLLTYVVDADLDTNLVEQCVAFTISTTHT